MRAKPDLPVETLPEWYVVYEFRAPDYSTRTWSSPDRGECHFGVMLAGRAELEWEDRGGRRRLIVQTGDAVFSGPSPGHWERNLDRPQVRTLWISVGWTPPAAGLAPVVHDQRGLLRTLAFELLAVYLDDLPPSAKRRRLNAFFLAFVAEYQRLSSGHPNPLVEKLRVYVKEHMTEPCPLAEVARHFGLGERQFSRRYKAAAGRTPKTEIDRVKAEHARIALLHMPEVALKDVAKRVGLGSDRQLRRLIKRVYGVRACDLPRRKQDA